MKVRITAPSPGLAVGVVALVVALSGTAYAVTTTQVNIADPGSPSHKAGVDSTGHLKISDGSGALTVNGTVIATLAPTDSFFHAQGFAFEQSCGVVATPPAGKALVLRTARIDVTRADGVAGQDSYIDLEVGSSSGFEQVNLMDPPIIGEFEATFDPGLVIPEGSELRSCATEGEAAVVFGDGYTVPSTAVGPAATVVQRHGQARAARPGH